jgi:hypothetical protein
MMPRERIDRASVFDLLSAFFEPEIKSWRGELPLGTIFWGYGVLAGISIGLLYAFSIFGGHVGLQQTLLPCIAGYTCWLLVCIWRSSKATENPLWGILARQLAVAWAGNTILILMFLQIDLIVRYLNS